MGKMTKSKKQQLRKKRTAQKIKKMENQDIKGISRKAKAKSIDSKVFVILKIISIVAIPVAYLLYSPLLIVCVLFSISMYLFAILAENKINHTFIKRNHIKFLKLDSIIAVIVLLMSFAGLIMSFFSKKKMPFGGLGMKISMNFRNFCSCQTGARSLIRLGGFKPKFGNVDFPSKGGAMPQMPPGGFNPNKFNIKLSDLPLEAVLSQMMSTITTVLIFLIPVAAIGTLIHYYYRKKRFTKEMNAVITEEYRELDDAFLDKVFLFGYELDPNYVEATDRIISVENS